MFNEDMDRGWTYEGYWYAVIGTASCKYVAEQNGITDVTSLEQWLTSAEKEAWSQGGSKKPMPESWASFHSKAVREISEFL